MESNAARPGPRVIVTTHNEDGTSIFGSDQNLKPFAPFGPSASSFSVFDVRPSVPVSNHREENGQELGSALPRCPPEGVLFCTTDIPPRFSAPMHRTLSLDYAVVVLGEIVLALDGGEEKIVRAGEFIVQRGANHEWHNRTDSVCRIAFVMVGAEKVKLAGGRELEETVFKK